MAEDLVPAYGPNGIVVKVPRGTPPEKVKQIIEEIAGIQSAQQPTSSVMGDVVGRVGIGQGLMMGYGDEAEAFLRSKLPGGRPYEEELADVRKKIETTQRERPIAATTAEVGGSVAPVLASLAAIPFTGGASAPAAAATAARTGTMFSNIVRGGLRGGAIGGGQGLVEGFGKGEGGFENRAERALGEGAVGLGVGGVLGAAAPVVSSAVSNLFASPTTRAQNRMLDVLGEQGVTPADVAADYARRQAQGVKPEIIADIYPGSAIAGESRRVLNVPGANRAEITEQLVGRMDEQGQRVAQAFEKATGTNQKFFPVLDDLEKVRKADAKPFYDAAYTTPARTKTLDELILRAPDNAFEEAQRAARYEGLVFPNLVAQNKDGARAIVGDYTVKDVDLVKRGLDRIIENNTDAITGKANSEARRATTLKNAIVSEVDKLSPEYAQARSAWAGPSAVMEAMKSGQRLFNERAEITARDIAKLGQSEKEGFLIGALDAVSQRIGRKIEGQDVTGAFRSGNAKQQIEAALGATGRKPEDVKAITNALFADIEREAMMANTNRQLRAISQTAPMMAEEKAFREGMRPMSGVLRDMQTGGFGGAVAGMFQRAGDRLATGLTEQGAQRTNAELGRMLFQNTQPGVQNVMDELTLRAMQRGRYAVPRALVPGLLADPLTDIVMPSR
jgi:hypothetical protein